MFSSTQRNQPWQLALLIMMLTSLGRNGEVFFSIKVFAIYVLLVDSLRVFGKGAKCPLKWSSIVKIIIFSGFLLFSHLFVHFAKFRKVEAPHASHIMCVSCAASTYFSNKKCGSYTIHIFIDLQWLIDVHVHNHRIICHRTSSSSMICFDCEMKDVFMT